jgi:hypothetical protein
MKKTAVEWLIGRFHYEGFIGTYCSEEQIKSKRQIMIEIIEQAKEMEKEQMCDFFREGYMWCNSPSLRIENGEIVTSTIKYGEFYYNKTFKNTQQ